MPLGGIEEAQPFVSLKFIKKSTFKDLGETQKKISNKLGSLDISWKFSHRKAFGDFNFF